MDISKRDFRLYYENTVIRDPQTGNPIWVVADGSSEDTFRGNVVGAARKTAYTRRIRDLERQHTAFPRLGYIPTDGDRLMFLSRPPIRQAVKGFSPATVSHDHLAGDPTVVHHVAETRDVRTLAPVVYNPAFPDPWDLVLRMLDSSDRCLGSAVCHEVAFLLSGALSAKEFMVLYKNLPAGVGRVFFKKGEDRPVYVELHLQDDMHGPVTRAFPTSSRFRFIKQGSSQ